MRGRALGDLVLEATSFINPPKTGERTSNQICSPFALASSCISFFLFFLGGGGIIFFFGGGIDPCLVSFGGSLIFPKLIHGTPPTTSPTCLFLWGEPVPGFRGGWAHLNGKPPSAPFSGVQEPRIARISETHSKPPSKGGRGVCDPNPKKSKPPGPGSPDQMNMGCKNLCWWCFLFVFLFFSVLS